MDELDALINENREAIREIIKQALRVVNDVKINDPYSESARALFGLANALAQADLLDEDKVKKGV